MRSHRIAIMLSDTSRLRDSTSRKSRRESVRSSVSAAAMASAERGFPSMRASSPKTWPGFMMLRISSDPEGDTETIFTRPETTNITLEPSSFFWKMIWFGG